MLFIINRHYIKWLTGSMNNIAGGVAMSFYEFSYMPIFYSLMSCAISFFFKKRVRTIKNDIAIVFITCLIICFTYPFVNYWLGAEYHYFGNFVLYCFLSTAISIAITLAIYFTYRKLKWEIWIQRNWNQLVEQAIRSQTRILS